MPPRSDMSALISDGSGNGSFYSDSDSNTSGIETTFLGNTVPLNDLERDLTLSIETDDIRQGSVLKGLVLRLLEKSKEQRLAIRDFERQNRKLKENELDLANSELKSFQDRVMADFEMWSEQAQGTDQDQQTLIRTLQSEVMKSRIVSERSRIDLEKSEEEARILTERANDAELKEKDALRRLEEARLANLESVKFFEGNVKELEQFVTAQQEIFDGDEVQYKAEIENLNEQIEFLNSELQTVKADDRDAHNVSQAMSAMDDLKETVEQLENQTHEKQAMIQERDEIIQSLRETLRCANKTETDYADGLAKEIKEKDRLNETLEDALRTQHELISERKTMADHLVAKEEELQKALDSEGPIVQNLQDIISTITLELNSYKDECETIKENSKMTENSYNHSLTQHKRELEKSRVHVCELEDSLHKAQVQVQLLEREREELRAQVNYFENQEYESKIRSLQQDLEVAKEECAFYKIQQEENEMQIETLESNVKRREKDLMGIQEDLANEHKERKSDEDKVQRLTSQLNEALAGGNNEQRLAVETKRANELQGNLNDVEAEVRVLEIRNQGLVDNEREAIARENRLKAEIETKNVQIRQLESDIAHSKQDLEKAHLDLLNRNLVEDAEEDTRLADEKMQNDEYLQSVQKKLSERENALEMAKSDNAQLQSELERVREDLESVNSIIAYLRNFEDKTWMNGVEDDAKTTLMQVIEKLSNVFNETGGRLLHRSNRESLTDETPRKAKLQDEVIDLTEKALTAEEQSLKLEDEIDRLKSENQRLKKGNGGETGERVGLSQYEQKQYEEEIMNARENIDDLQEQLHMCREKVGELEDTIARVEQDRDDKIRERDAEYNSVVTELNLAKSNYNTLKFESNIMGNSMNRLRDRNTPLDAGTGAHGTCGNTGGLISGNLEVSGFSNEDEGTAQRSDFGQKSGGDMSMVVERELDRLRTEVHEKEKQIERLQDQLGNLQLQGNSSTNTGATNDINRRLEYMERELTDAKEATDAQKNRAENLEIRLSRDQYLHQATVKSLEDQLHMAQNGMLGMTDDIQNQLAEQRGALEEKRRETVDLMIELADNKEKVLQLSENVVDLNKRLEQAKRDNHTLIVSMRQSNGRDETSSSSSEDGSFMNDAIKNTLATPSAVKDIEQRMAQTMQEVQGKLQGVDSQAVIIEAAQTIQQLSNERDALVATVQNQVNALNVSISSTIDNSLSNLHQNAKYWNNTNTFSNNQSNTNDNSFVPFNATPAKRNVQPERRLDTPGLVRSTEEDVQKLFSNVDRKLHDKFNQLMSIIQGLESDKTQLEYDLKLWKDRVDYLQKELASGRVISPTRGNQVEGVSVIQVGNDDELDSAYRLQDGQADTSNIRRRPLDESIRELVSANPAASEFAERLEQLRRDFEGAKAFYQQGGASTRHHSNSRMHYTQSHGGMTSDIMQTLAHDHTAMGHSASDVREGISVILRAAGKATNLCRSAELAVTDAERNMHAGQQQPFSSHRLHAIMLALEGLETTGQTVLASFDECIHHTIEETRKRCSSEMKRLYEENAHINLDVHRLRDVENKCNEKLMIMERKAKQFKRKCTQKLEEEHARGRNDRKNLEKTRASLDDHVRQLHEERETWLKERNHMQQITRDQQKISRSLKDKMRKQKVIHDARHARMGLVVKERGSGLVALLSQLGALSENSHTFTADSSYRRQFLRVQRMNQSLCFQKMCLIAIPQTTSTAMPYRHYLDPSPRARWRRMLNVVKAAIRFRRAGGVARHELAHNHVWHENAEDMIRGLREVLKTAVELVTTMHKDFDAMVLTAEMEKLYEADSNVSIESQIQSRPRQLSARDWDEQSSNFEDQERVLLSISGLDADAR
eukprot:CFRG5640T1